MGRERRENGQSYGERAGKMLWRIRHGQGLEEFEHLGAGLAPFMPLTQFSS
jgi:hypothetical protein